MGCQKENLLILITKKKWTKILERIASYPTEAQSRDNDGYLPIHHACWCLDFPVQVIESLIAAYPQSVELKSPKGGLIPLHYAVSRKSCTKFHVVQVLLWHYREGASVRDVHGRTPLLYHLFHSPNLSLDLTKMLVNAHPDAVRIRDKHLRYPLHFAAKSGNWEVSKYLIDLFPEALMAKTKSDRTPLDVANTFGKHQLCDYLREEEAKRFGSIYRAFSHSKENPRQNQGKNSLVKKMEFQDTVEMISVLPKHSGNHSVEVLSIESKRVALPKKIDNGEEESNILSQRNHIEKSSLCKNIKSTPTLSTCGNRVLDTDAETIATDFEVSNIVSSLPENNVTDCNSNNWRSSKDTSQHFTMITRDTRSISTVPTLLPSFAPNITTVINFVGKEHLINTKVNNNISRNFQMDRNNNTIHFKTNKMEFHKDYTTKGICNPKLMSGLLQNLEEAEALWDVKSQSKQSVVHRVHTIERKVFQNVRNGGLKCRLLNLFFVDGIGNGTWVEWVDEIEQLLLKEKQEGSIIERIKFLEVVVEGEVQTGNWHDRLLSLNKMGSEFLSS